jgi:hypothetical protein
LDRRSQPDNQTKGGVREEELRVDKREYSIVAQEDFPRVDSLCRGLLLAFYEHLLAEGLPPEEATSLASGADLYLRDFLVDCKGHNLFDEKPGMVKQFAGNWYIVHTLEPDINQLGGHLLGIRAFYAYLRGRELISPDYLASIEADCDAIAYYQWRIESFWEIQGDGFAAWEKECTLKDNICAAGRA